MKIEINNLQKIYKNGTKAVNNIDLTIQNGMFGLLGPNGAGKTSLMKILVTLMKPTSGHISVNGYDIHKNRREIRLMTGYLPQDFKSFSKLTTWEFLDYAASLAGIKKKSDRSHAVEDMLEKVGLYEVRTRLAGKLSGGMKRRLGIAQALIGEPQIVVVDEPTTGLDPEERIRFRNLLSDMSQKDIIIILSTHIVGDISSTCKDMALLHKGEIVFTGSPDMLIDETKGHVWSIKAAKHELDTIKEKFTVISTIPSDEGYEVHVVSDHPDGFPGEEIEPNLEHSYVYFMENKLTSFTK